MSTPSMLLLCAGAAASLAGVWTLAGLSERSALRTTPRVVLATVIGLLGEAALYGRAPAGLRAELSLPLLFGTASVLALAVGAAKIEGALLEKDGGRVVRRASGIIAGSIFGMAAVGAASLDLSSVSLRHAQLGWGLMFALVASVLVVFAARGRYVGAGFFALGQRALVLALVSLALLLGARFTVAAPSPSPARLVPEVVSIDPPAAPPSLGAAGGAPPEAGSAGPELALPSASASAEAAPSAAPPGEPGPLEIDAVTPRGLLEADARGGVTRRMDRLQACLEDPKHQQHGALTLKVGIDPSGSVEYAKVAAGDLRGTPLASCLLLQFYKMGFAAPASNNASFDITLRAP